MQSIKFIRYFFYLAANWNFRIAFHILKNELKGEKKFGIETTGADELLSLEEKGIDITHSTIYMPVSYDVLKEIFERFPPCKFVHFLDIGCGKGRALCVAATMGANKISGIELSKDFCEITKQNLEIIKKQQQHFGYKIFNNDAFYFEIETDVDCIFMFNPFDDIIMSGVLENIEISLKKKCRKMTVIYVNPLQKHLFLENGYQEIFHFQKMHYLEVSVFTK
jgi:16S rRNA G966 N2-methylase RsmD